MIGKMILTAGAGLALTSMAAVNITENTALQADTDWRDQGVVTIAEGVTLNLNGHHLKVSGLVCNGSVTSAEQKFRYYRFKIDANRNGKEQIQIGELKLFNGETDITDQRVGVSWNDATYPAQFKPNYTPDKAFDSNLDTEWFDNRLTGNTVDDVWVVVEYAEPVCVNRYQWYTGIDTKNWPGRNPTSWRFQGSNDNATWTDLEVVVDNQTCTTANKTLAYTGGSVANDPTLEFDLTAGNAFTLVGTCSVAVKVLGGTLASDVDLRSWGDRPEFGDYVYLNGHRLSIANLKGEPKFANVVTTYRRLNYIESSGKQWIDTGFLTTHETAIDFDFTVLSDSGNNAYFCGDWAVDGHLFVGNSTGMNFFGKGAALSAFTANVHRRLVTIPGGAKTVIYSDGDTGEELASSDAALTHNGTSTMTLFAANNDGSKPVDGYHPASYRLHSFKLTHQGTVVRDLVPVERTADGKGGLYDLANDTFYPSIGSGDFIKGPVTAVGYGLDDSVARGELYVDVTDNAVLTNSMAALTGNVQLIKAGAGTYVERHDQVNLGGVKLAAGRFAFETETPSLVGPLTFAGGTLVLTEGVPLTVTNDVSVSAASGIEFRRGALAGRKAAITGFGAETPLAQLTLTVLPAIELETTLALEGDDLQVVIGGVNEVIQATWTGAQDGDVTKSANWNCTNRDGDRVAGALPASYTHVTVGGAGSTVAMQAPVGASFAYGKLEITNCTLAADCDWRGLGVLDIVGTVDLAGHKLHTCGLTGSGTLTSGHETRYRSYRFKVDATGGSMMQISEIKLYYGATEITGNRTNLSWGHVWSESTYYPNKAFDGNTGTKWFDNVMTGAEKDNVYAVIEYAEPVVVDRYQWFTGDDTKKFPDRNPRSWRFQGSNDGTNWIDLDVVVDNTRCATANKTCAYTKVLDITPGGDGSEVHVEVAAGRTETHATAKLAGQLKLVKDGAGTLVMSSRGQTYCGGTEIAAGYLKPGVGGDTTLFGASCSTMTVTKGAQFLDDVFAYNSTSFIRWVIEGMGPDGKGAIRATTCVHSKMNNALVAWGVDLTLTGDALISHEEYAFDFVAPDYGTFPLTLNGHTLTLKSAKEASQHVYPYFLFSNVQGLDTGTLVVGENIQLYPYQGEAGVLANVSLVIDEKASYTTGDNNDARDLTVSNLVYRSASVESQSKRTTYVLGRYTPASSTSAPKVQLGDANHVTTTLDVSGLSGTFDCAFGGGLTFQAGSTVQIDVGARRMMNGTKLLAWTQKPENVNFTMPNNPSYGVYLKDDGLYILRGLVILIH